MKTVTLESMDEDNLISVLKKSRYTDSDIKKLFESDMLEELLPVVRRNGRVMVGKHIIDTNHIDEYSSVLHGSAIVRTHDGHGQIEWDSEKFSLLRIDGRLVAHYELDGKIVALNAYMLDYFLKHPSLISNKIKKDMAGVSEKIFFSEQPTLS